MLRVFATPTAIFFKLDFTLNQFTVLATPIINALAGSASEFD